MEQQRTYTESAIIEKIMEVLNTPKYAKICESFRYNTSGTFLFNPLDDEEVNDIYLQYSDEFPNYVRKAVTWVCCDGLTGQLAEILKRDLKIQLTPNTMIKLNEWASRHENTPISAKCQIIGALKEQTYTKSAECYCLKCGHREKVINNMLPYVCENPECTGRRIVLDHSTIVTGDIKTIIIQEPMEEVKHGTPTIKTCVVKDDLVFDSYPGQRKIITGVFKSSPVKNSDRNNITINAISMQNLDDEKLVMPDDLELSQFQSMAKKENYLDRITQSFAPEIKFRDLEKLAVIISRIGAKKSGRIRGNIHSLLVGPPATAKSKILEFLPYVTQRSGFAVGGMSTGSSITVTMTTLPDKTKFPKGGIVVQCSGSCVALDELNQFPDEDIGKTYTAMESGKILYNKAGFDQTFMADTTIIAGANPKSGYYVPSLGMVKNINLPAPMISRFDIIINVLPEQGTQSQQISDHTYMIKEIGVGAYISKNNLMTADQLMKLFNHCQSLDVTVTNDAKKVIDDYVGMMMQLQNSGDQEEGSKQFDRRFIESVMRIAEALTRLHLQTVMTKEMAMMAIEYIKKTHETFGLKTESGMMQAPLEQVDKKDKELAFDLAWKKMCKQADSELLPEWDFVKFLFEEYPKPFGTQNKAAEFFKQKADKGDLIAEHGRYRLV